VKIDFDRRPANVVRTSLALFALGGLWSSLPAVETPAPAFPPPPWAYVVKPADAKSASDDGRIRRVPGSTAGYSLTQVSDLFLAPDWHPEEHPAMPEIIVHGRKPNVFACGFCHRADGPGGPENSSLAGLPFDYIVQQLADYKAGRRSTALPKRAPQALMISLSREITDEEVRAAARYFSSLKPRANLRVVETEVVPATHEGSWFLGIATDGRREPLGQRIVETPLNLERFESRDTHARFIAYAPVGSVARGGAIVSGQAAAKAPACAACHGPDLRGVGPIPSIAGRSPSYIVRQLYEIQAGIRAGTNVAPMKASIAQLDQMDMIAVAAYLATLEP
jgi:cytochrome c553